MMCDIIGDKRITNLLAINNKRTKHFCVVKTSRLQENILKQ